MGVMFLLRYWLFSDVVPGLYIEKGWVHEAIDYNFTPPPEDKPAESEIEEEEDSEAATAPDSQGFFYLFNGCLVCKIAFYFCVLFFCHGAVVISIVFMRQVVKRMMEV